VPAACLLASHLLQAGDATQKPEGAYARSLHLARQALERRPGDEGVLRVLASVHFRQGKFRDAIAAYQEVLRVNPGNLEAQLGVAQSCLQLEDFAAAERELRKLLGERESQPTAQARRELAEICFRQGRYPEAVRLLREAIERGDRSGEMWFLLGQALEAAAREARVQSRPQDEIQRNEADAVAALEEALRLDPSRAQAHYVLASIARRQGRSQAAAASLGAFRKLKGEAPTVDLAGAAHAEAAFEVRTAIELGRALLAVRDLDGARALAAHALTVQPGAAETLSFQAWVALQSGQTEEAAAIYRRILEREPKHAESLWNLGRIHMKAGDLQAAAPLLLQAAEVRPGFADAWELLLVLAQEHGILADRTRELATRALQARPSAGNYARLAMVLFAERQLDDCGRTIEEGLRRHPRDADLLAARAALEQARLSK
jgi:tetratricopeptide (TPR) repeat protein